MRGPASLLVGTLVPFYLFCLMGYAATVKQVRAFCQKQMPMMVLLLVFSALRVGEASHPGPAADDSNFVVWVANPTGLLSKATYVAEYMDYGDLWAISETHLSSSDVSSFNTGLRFQQSPSSRSWVGIQCRHLSIQAVGKGLVSCPKRLYVTFLSPGRKRFCNRPEPWL